MYKTWIRIAAFAAILSACAGQGTSAPAAPTLTAAPAETATEAPVEAATFPPSSEPYESIAGTYEVSLTEDELTAAGAGLMLATGSQGTWQLELTDDGTARILQESAIGLRPRAEGPYSLTAGEIYFGADTGDYACTNFDVQQGSYAWELTGGQLSLTVLNDDCEDRRILLIVKPLTRQN